MLALTDESLARIAIAATAIAPTERGLWLARFAEAAEPKSEPADLPRRSSAARQKRARQRIRAGKCILRLEVAHDEFILALLETERITETAALDRRNVEAAAAGVLEDFWKRFLGGMR